MDLDQMLLIQRQAARIGELEEWLALMVISYGQPDGPGFRYAICDAHAHEFRQKLGNPLPSVSIDFDVDQLKHIITVT